MISRGEKEDHTLRYKDQFQNLRNAESLWNLIRFAFDCWTLNSEGKI